MLEDKLLEGRLPRESKLFRRSFREQSSVFYFPEWSYKSNPIDGFVCQRGFTLAGWAGCVELNGRKELDST